MLGSEVKILEEADDGGTKISLDEMLVG